MTESVAIWDILLMGISVGVTSCTLTCLPILGGWTLGQEGTPLESVRDTILFLTGKLAGYLLLG